MASGSDPAAAQRLVFYRRAVAGGRLELAQVWFAAEVLAPYRERPGYKLLRTNTIGMLQGARWRLDFGIADDETLIHLSIGVLKEALPERELAHWLAHLHSPPVSRAYLTAQLTQGACLEDGDVRSWG